MDIQNDVIGIVGGMGAYATVNIFERILDAFEAKKEWERPRIIIDSYNTLPSRSRALLYGEQKNVVINGLANSVKNLMYSGANIIILGSNTAYLFIDDIIRIVPESKSCIINIVEKCAQDVSSHSVKNVLLLGTDATVDLGMYQTIFKKYNVEIQTPAASEQKEVVEFIEVVKQNVITEVDVVSFSEFLNGFDSENIVLGCTELPVLYKRCMAQKLSVGKKIFDPIDSVIKFLREE